MKWEEFRDRQRQHPSPALDSAHATWEQIAPKLHDGLTRPQSSLATLLRTEVVGFNAFLYKQKVPGIISQGCPCGESYQNARHVVMDCPLYEEDREEMLTEAGTRNYSILMNKPKGVKACVKWVMKKRLLAQFSFAQDMEEEIEGEGQVAWQGEQNETNAEEPETDEPTDGELEVLGSEDNEEEEEEI